MAMSCAPAALCALLALLCAQPARASPALRPQILRMPAFAFSPTNLLPHGVVYDPVAGYTYSLRGLPRTDRVEDPIAANAAASHSVDVHAHLRAAGLFTPGDVYSVEKPVLTHQVDAKTAVVHQATSTITITGEQSEFKVTLEDSMPKVAREPFESSVRQWADVFPSKSPIRIRFSWEELDEGVLGGANTAFFIRGTSHEKLDNNTMYGAPIAAALTGKDFVPKSEYHIVMSFNSEEQWSFDPDQQTKEQVDLQSVALHEICHGLFFGGNLEASSRQERANFVHRNNVPARIDRFLADGGGKGLAQCRKPDMLFGAVTSSKLQFEDPEDPSVAFGLYSPSVYDSGSSVYHLDPERYLSDCQNAGLQSTDEDCSNLMLPSADGGFLQRSIGTNTKRIMKAILSSEKGYVADDCEL